MIWILLSGLAWLFCFHLNRDGFIHSGNGGGCFGGGSSQPVINVPPTPAPPSAEELVSQSISQTQSAFPEFFGARETGIGRLGAGEFQPTLEDYSKYQLTGEDAITPDFFNQFQPTDFAQATAGSFFGDALEQAKRVAGHRASLSGIESAFPDLFARAISPAMFDIGSFLSNQGMQQAQFGLQDITNLRNLGQQRAETGIASRQGEIAGQIGLDPTSFIMQQAGLGANQANAALQIQQQNNMNAAMAEYQRQVNEQQQSQGLMGTLGTLGGAGLGALFAAPTGGLSMAAGASLGAGLGGAVSPLFGGGQAPVGMADALSMAQLFSPGSFPGSQANMFKDIFGGMGGAQSSTQEVFTPPTFPKFEPMKVGNAGGGSSGFPSFF